MSHRPTVYGTRHAVSAGHYLAAAAAFSILEAGGNAIDAGCAAGIALGVLQPDLVNVAGVAPIMIRLANGLVESIAGLGWWPKSIPADLFMREHPVQQDPPTVGGLRTVTSPRPTPGSPRCDATARCASPSVASYAVRLPAKASRYPLLATSIASHEHEYRRWQSNTAIYLPNNRVPKSGEKLCSRPVAHLAAWPTRTAPPALTAKPDPASRAR